MTGCMMAIPTIWIWKITTCVLSLKCVEIKRPACGAGDSIKPGVERSGTPGGVNNNYEPAKAGGSAVDRRAVMLVTYTWRTVACTLSPAFAGFHFFLDSFLGFRCTPPQALCCRLLRRLMH